MNQPKTSKAEAWQIGGEYITDTEGNPRFRVMGSAPYNTEWMERAVKAVNEYEALNAVAEAAERHQDSKPGEELRHWAQLQDALSALAALRAKEKT